MGKLDGFTGRDLRIAERVMIVMSSNSITLENLADINKEGMPSIDPVPHPTRRKKGSKPKRVKKAPSPNKILRPGESYITEMRCECGGKILLEGVCGSAAIRKGLVRTGMCIECDNYFAVR